MLGMLVLKIFNILSTNFSVVITHFRFRKFEFKPVLCDKIPRGPAGEGEGVTILPKLALASSVKCWRWGTFRSWSTCLWEWNKCLGSLDAKDCSSLKLSVSFCFSCWSLFLVLEVTPSARPIGKLCSGDPLLRETYSLPGFFVGTWFSFSLLSGCFCADWTVGEWPGISVGREEFWESCWLRSLYQY